MASAGRATASYNIPGRVLSRTGGGAMRVGRIGWLVLVLGAADGPSAAADPPAAKRPLLRDFLGLNGHTVQFRPELYKPVCRLVRDYHPFDWDVGGDSSFPPPFPLARNKVDWGKVYGSWKDAGYDTDVCLMVDQFPAEKWKDLPRDAYAYGRAFAAAFGPSARRPLVSSAEVGNEPGGYDDAAYRTLFEHMAKGLRDGDPKLRVVTCAADPGPSGKYHKSLACVKGLERLYDVINVHTYAEVEGYPTWRRTFPEDPKTPYLKRVKDAAVWRDAHTPGKELWVTEFGWDASTKPAPKTGTFAKWVGSTEAEQARYLVRSVLLFSALPVDRAYIYFFNDQDEPHVHGSSGLTRNFVPKPAFHALAHLQRTLGEYRFVRVVADRPGELAVYEFAHGTDPGKRVWAVWSPTGSGREAEVSLPVPAAAVARAERMPLRAGPAEVVKWAAAGADGVTLTVGEDPIYLWLTGR